MRIIAFEGPDGVGKTTHAKLLAERLTNNGLNVIIARQPDFYRDAIMTKDLTEEERVALLLMDYDVTVNKYYRTSEEPDILIFDRVPHISFFAYNLHEIAPEYQDLFTEVVSDRFIDCIAPDIIFLLDRMSFRESDGSLYESRNKQEDLLERYENIPVLDASGDIFGVPYIKVFLEAELDEDCTKEELTEVLLEIMENMGIETKSTGILQDNVQQYAVDQ